jgi:hypothetical protein
MEVGKLIKYMEKQFLPKMDFPFTSYDKKLVFLWRIGNFFPWWAQRKKAFLSQSCGQLLWNFSPSSLGQDLTVKNAKKIVWASWARNGSFEVFFKKKELCPSRVRPWICVFLIFFIFLNSDGLGSNECTYCSDFLKYDFIISMGMQTFAFVHCIFSIHQQLGIFAPCFITQVGLQFGTICLNIRTNMNVNFHTPRDHLISYNSMQDQIFIPWAGRE